MNRLPPIAEIKELRAFANRSWSRTSQGRLICPDCGATGWTVGVISAGSAWIDKHLEHTKAPCGKVLADTRSGVAAHRRNCPSKKCGTP